MVMIIFSLRDVYLYIIIMILDVETGINKLLLTIWAAYYIADHCGVLTNDNNNNNIK